MLRSKRQQQLFYANLKPDLQPILEKLNNIELKPKQSPVQLGKVYSNASDQSPIQLCKVNSAGVEQNPVKVNSTTAQLINNNIENDNDMVTYSHSLEAFDEKASHDSFLEALNQWRKLGQKNDTTNTFEENTSISSTVETETVEYTQNPKIQEIQVVSFDGRINYQNSLTYFDRLKINSIRAEMKINEITSKLYGVKNQGTENSNINVCDNNGEDTMRIISGFTDEEYKESEGEVKSFIVSNGSVVIDEPILNDSEKPSEGVYDLPRNSNCCEILIEDISDDCDDVIIDLLKKGQMVECIPSDRLVYVDPAE